MRPHDLTRFQLLIRFGYDGARFRGVQPQGRGIPTAGQAVKDRLLDAAGAPPKGLNFAARTDSGVHAVANLATCYFRDVDPVAAEQIRSRLEAVRDDGLVHVRAFRVPPTVHARGSARGKRYRYLVDDGADPAQLQRDRSWAVVPTLDVAAMRDAARFLEGTHDFSSLRAGNCSAASATKTIARVRVGGPFPLAGPREGGPRRLLVEVAGNAFLRKMMRNLTGLLVEVGAGLRAPEEVTAVLAARDRSAAGVCAPPQGLSLLAVGCAWPDDGSGLIREILDASPSRTVAASLGDGDENIDVDE